ASSTAHVVTGTVFDSVAGQPLAGAIVQIVLADSTSRAFSAVSNIAGRYRIRSLPSGRYAIGFQHRSLEALGLESPISAFELETDTSITVDLAIPSGRVVRARKCERAARDSMAGLLAGLVLDDRSSSS